MRAICMDHSYIVDCRYFNSNNERDWDPEQVGLSMYDDSFKILGLGLGATEMEVKVACGIPNTIKNISS